MIIVMFSYTAVWLAVFAGWQMKSAICAKSLNFSSEGLYNLWRIAVRIIVPLAVVLAMVGMGARTGKMITADIAFAPDSQTQLRLTYNLAEWW